jgi:subtilisin family serine protease
VLSIAAAGNSGTTQVSYPASYCPVVSAVAIDSNKNLTSFTGVSGSGWRIAIIREEGYVWYIAFL